MPTYDYQCEACSHAFEAFQQITAAPLVECPQCKTPSLKRLIGAGAGPIFKGTGFYCTDYKHSSRKQDESVDRHKKAAADVKASTNGATAPSPSSGTSSSSTSTNASTP
jgi:putative FmdB family regulatory protein